MALFNILDIDENIEREGITEDEAMELISSNATGEPNQYYYYPIEHETLVEIQAQFRNDIKQVKFLKRQN